MTTTTETVYTATLPRIENGQGPTNAKNYKGNKPLWYSLKLLAIVPLADSGYWLQCNRAPIVELAELCVWGPKSANGMRVYASVWVHAKDNHFSGYGTAGGYGYCKASAASYAAMESAGLAFLRDGKQWDFGGAGMSEVEKALFAIGRALGFEDSALYVVQGA